MNERYLERAREYKKEHADEVREYNKQWYYDNKDKAREHQKKYAENNKEKIAAYKREWALKNKHKTAQARAKRRSQKKNANPAWADKGYMNLFYYLAKKETARVGEKVTVDHIVPLQSDVVCGLHCEHNMQLMTARDNSAKGNYWWPEMWNIEDET